MAKKEEKMVTTAEALSKFASERGYDISQVFDHFCQYIVWAHTLPEYGAPIKGWPYKPEDGKQFYNIYCVLIQELNEHLKHAEWYDVFGDLYEELIASKNRRQKAGQFFTPNCLCDLMTQLSVPQGDKVKGKRISDPTCGSGRNLLAFHSQHPGNYCVGEDLDKTCALMTVCNFILHGVDGEVIWHNTLIPDDFKGGWRVNEQLNNPFSKYRGIPHVRPISEEEYRERFRKDEAS